MTAIFLKKICLWFLGQIKWAQNSQGSIQIVSGITRVFLGVSFVSTYNLEILQNPEENF